MSIGWQKAFLGNEIHLVGVICEEPWLNQKIGKWFTKIRIKRKKTSKVGKYDYLTICIANPADVAVEEKYKVDGHIYGFKVDKKKWCQFVMVDNMEMVNMDTEDLNEVALRGEVTFVEDFVGETKNGYKYRHVCVNSGASIRVMLWGAKIDTLAKGNHASIRGTLFSGDIEGCRETAMKVSAEYIHRYEE